MLLQAMWEATDGTTIAAAASASLRDRVQMGLRAAGCILQACNGAGQVAGQREPAAQRSVTSTQHSKQMLHGYQANNTYVMITAHGSLQASRTDRWQQEQDNCCCRSCCKSCCKQVGCSLLRSWHDVRSIEMARSSSDCQKLCKL